MIVVTTSFSESSVLKMSEVGRLEERFHKAPIVDGRSNRSNKAEISCLSGVVWTGYKLEGKLSQTTQRHWNT